MAVLKLCGHANCPHLAERSKRYCPHHEAQSRARDRERGSARERGYTAEWERYRSAYLAKHPLCVECAAGTPLRGEKPRSITPATVVDHIRPHKGDRSLFWDPANHRAVCKPHHDARVDEGDFGNLESYSAIANGPTRQSFSSERRPPEISPVKIAGGE